MGKCSTILMEAKTWRPLSRTREREVGGGGGVEVKIRWVTNPAAPGAAPTHVRPSGKPAAVLAAVRGAASRTVKGGRLQAWG